MKLNVVFLGLIAFMALGSTSAVAQAPPAPSKLSEVLAKNLAANKGETSAENRMRAFAKLLEAQRHIWRSNPARGRAAAGATPRQARAALQTALELDPTLAEAYTTLAELSLRLPPTDIEEAIALAALAVKVDPNNFGGHRILARLYTYKSNLNNGPLDQTMTGRAVEAWREVVRLDPRNAEGWAFLAEFYSATSPNDQIDALKKWMASATPLESDFYRRIMGPGSDLSPERASLKLGKALVRGGRSAEAVEVLSLLVADEPDNDQAIEHLREALSGTDAKTAGIAVEALRQAAFANQGNGALVALLAQTQARAGKLDEATTTLRDAVERARISDVNSAASLQVALGDLFADADRLVEAASAYESALRLRGLDKPRVVPEGERNFAMAVFEKLINTYRRANRQAEARAAILRARQLLGEGVFSS